MAMLVCIAINSDYDGKENRHVPSVTRIDGT